MKKSGRKKMTKNNPTILGGLLRYQRPLIVFTYILFISVMYLYSGLLMYQWLLVVWTSFLFFSVLYLYLKRWKEPKIEDYTQRKDMEPQIELRKAQRKAEEEEKQLRNEREQKRIAMRHQANERERALDYDSAIDIWEELGQIDQAARVRKLKADLVAPKTVIHGNYVDDRDTIVNDSVVNRSNIGIGSSKMQKLEKLNNMREKGAIDEEEFKQMKKEIASGLALDPADMNALDQMTAANQALAPEIQDAQAQDAAERDAEAQDAAMDREIKKAKAMPKPSANTK